MLGLFSTTTRAAGGTDAPTSAGVEEVTPLGRRKGDARPPAAPPLPSSPPSTRLASIMANGEGDRETTLPMLRLGARPSRPLQRLGRGRRCAWCVRLRPLTSMRRCRYKILEGICNLMIPYLTFFAPSVCLPPYLPSQPPCRHVIARAFWPGPTPAAASRAGAPPMRPPPRDAAFPPWWPRRRPNKTGPSGGRCTSHET